MADINIGAKLTVDTGASLKSINDINKEIKAASDAMKAAKVGTDEYKAAQEQLKKAQEELSATTKQHATTFSQLKEQLHGTVPGFKAAEEGASGLGKQLLALLANPVVLAFAAIAAALVGLYKAFTLTDEGGQKVKAIFDGIGAVLRELVQRASAAANSIVKLMEGDFKGAAEAAKKSVTGFGDAMVDAFQRGKDASDMLDEVEDAMRVLDLQQSAMNAKLAKSKELINDETASQKEKRDALKESGTEIESYYKKKAELDDKEIDAIAKKYNIESNVKELRKKGYVEGAKEFDDYLQTLAIGKEGIKDIEGTIKKAIDSGAEYSAKQRQQIRAGRALDRQDSALAKQDIDDEKKKHDDLIKSLDEEQKLRTKIWTSMKESGLLTLKDYRAAEKKIEDDKAKKIKQDFDDQLKLQKEFLANKQGGLMKEIETYHAVEDSKRLDDIKTAEVKLLNLQIVSNAASSFAALIGQQTLVGKMLGIASATIDTYIAAGKALSSAPPPFGAIAMAATIAQGIANVRRIATVNIPGTSGGGGSVPSAPIAPSAPLTPPTIGTTRIDQNQINQMGSAAAPRAFVVESDIRNNQERITMLNRAARIGG